MKGSILIYFISGMLLFAMPANAAPGNFWQEANNSIACRPGKEKKNADKIPVKKEKTTFQTRGTWKPTTDTRSDAAIVYGVNDVPAIVLKCVCNPSEPMNTITIYDRYVMGCLSGLFFG